MGLIYKNIISIKDYFGDNEITVNNEETNNISAVCFDPAQLKIPDYQRPYKWTKKNVIQLMNDIIHHSKKHNVNYRLGTVVLHKSEENNKVELNIVDGQQRTITLAMICHALKNIEKYKNDIKEVKFLKNKFENSISQGNIYNNYQTIKEYIIEFDESVKNFLLNNCELVVVILKDESEAFQFFDSQNTRGKELYPHDLLKAFHLREIDERTDKINIVETWQNHDSKDLNELLGTYLYRIKSWSMDKPAIKFSKDDIHLFKGISQQHHKYPYSELYRMADAFVETNSGVSKYVGYKISYPFQIDSVIINGERFFEMMGYYLEKLKPIRELENIGQYAHILKGLGIYEVAKDGIDTPKSKATSIIEFLTDYDKKNRTGDKYIREMFNCILLYYIDKFGVEDLEKAIKKYFEWAYSLRLEMQSVYIESINNYALGDKLLKEVKIGFNPFEIIRNSFTPFDGIEFENSKYNYRMFSLKNNAKNLSLDEILIGKVENEQKEN